ncbi:MAG: hypothetical protein JWN04_4309 [Myxococcaceae bacterium]|nr:hypothetical protein [Myxococcaceae bacterium]
MDAGLGYASLIDNTQWRRYDAGLDPLKSHQPAQIACGVGATYVEYGSFEVDTNRCNYLLAQNLALRPVDLGSTVHFKMLYFDLLAPEPAQAHVALFFGDDLQWETMLSIPQPGNSLDVTFKASAELDFQEPIRLHLHNHGDNAYLIETLEVAR